MMPVSEVDIDKGQSVYTPFTLKVYNLLVLNISNRWIWRCSKKTQLDQFKQLVSANHLDIGVGTGYYLQHCQWPPQTRISLLDLNPNCLDTAKSLLHAYEPDTYLADIFKPQPELANKFSSISMNYLLHCLPGNMKIKEIAIHNATSMLKPGGILFGATILGDEHLQSKLSRTLAGFYNKKGIFSNQEDTLVGLENALKTHLADVEIKVVGCVALFKGRRD